MTTEDLQVSWLHCNICHRAFESHNQLKFASDRIILVHSDLHFYFTGCGHFFCENCLNDGSFGGNINNLVCRICGEKSQGFKIHSTIPEKVAMYLKPPIGLLEDSLSIMMFQLNNANKLIGALRSKISNQKDLLIRAKQELASVKELKEKIKFLEDERGSFNPAAQIDPNETLRIPNDLQHLQQTTTIFRNGRNNNNQHQIQQNNNIQFSPFMNGNGTHQTKSFVRHNTNNRNFHTNNLYNNNNPLFSNNIPPDSPVIHAQGRLSLKSPSVNAQMNSPFPGQGQNLFPLRSSKTPRPVVKRPPYQ